jgi:mRNA interferase HigB
MRVIAKRTLREFWESNPKYAESQGQLEAWYQEAKSANWKNPQDIKNQFRNASVLKGGRIIFNICGNKYRLIVKIHFETQIVYIRFVGTHKEYDDINAEEI